MQQGKTSEHINKTFYNKYEWFYNNLGNICNHRAS